MLVDTLIITNKAYMVTAFDTAISPTDEEINSGTHARDGIHPEYMGFTVCLLMAENLCFCDTKIIKFHALGDYTGHSRVLGTLRYIGVFL